MKKYILICFMASLCLYGSTLKAQVADPPGADFLHRSRPTVPHELRDIHRGGETRSDTLSELSDKVNFWEQEQDSVSVVIYGEISDYGEVGEVTLKFWPVMFDPSIQNPGPEVQRMMPFRSNIFQTVLPAFDRQFLFRVPAVSSPGYIRLEADNYRYLDTYLVMPGDSIMVRVDRISNSTVFTGPSAPLFRCQQELKQYALEQELDRPKIFHLGPDGSLSSEQQVQMDSARHSFGRKSQAIAFGAGTLEELKRLSDGRTDAGLTAVLDRYRDSIGEEAYVILKAEMLSADRFRAAYTFYKYAYPMALKSGDDGLVIQYQSFFRDRLSQLGGFMEYRPEMLHSPGYVGLRNAVLMAESKVTGEDYTGLAGNVSDAGLRSKMVTAHFLDRGVAKNRDGSQLKKGLALVEEEPYKSILDHHASRHLKGSDVPDFELENSTGEKVSLSDFRGKTVLVDFYLSGCKACLAFSDDLEKIAQKLADRDDVVILSISVDRDRSVWEKSLSSGKYSVTGSIDLFTEEKGHEHALTSFYGISLVPHLMLIAPDGSLLRSGFYPMNYDQIFPELSRLLQPEASNNTTKSIQPNRITHGQ